MSPLLKLTFEAVEVAPQAVEGHRSLATATLVEGWLDGPACLFNGCACCAYPVCGFSADVFLGPNNFVELVANNLLLLDFVNEFAHLTREFIPHRSRLTRLLVVCVSRLTEGRGFGVHHVASLFEQGLHVGHRSSPSP